MGINKEFLHGNLYGYSRIVMFCTNMWDEQEISTNIHIYWSFKFMVMEGYYM